MHLAIIRAACLFLLCGLLGTASAVSIFKDRFELDSTPPEISLYAYLVPENLACHVNNRGNITQDTVVKICYQLSNESASRTLDQHLVSDDVLGVTWQGSDLIAPGSSITVVADVAPFQMDGWESHFVEWVAQAGALEASVEFIQRFSYNPYIKLRTLLLPDDTGCQQGAAGGGGGGVPYSSGWLEITAAAGTPLTVCYKAWNGGETLVNRHRLTDENDDVLLVSTDTLGQQGIYSFPRTITAVNTATVSGTWRAGFNADEDQTRSSASAQIEVKTNPACDGAAFVTTVDHGMDLGVEGFPSPAGSSGLRLDYTVTSTPVSPNQPVTFAAHGEIVDLPGFGGSVLFGPRDDTRVTIDIPPGINLASISVDAVMDGHISLTPVIDTVAGKIILSTGPVSGAPATIDVEITATPDGSVLPLEFHAPLIELDLNMEVFPGFYVETLIGIPDPDAPPIFIAEECTT